MNGSDQLNSTPAIDRFGPEFASSFFGAMPQPLVIQPAIEGIRKVDNLLAWARASIHTLDEAIAHHGAILLRGFAVDDTPQFERVSELFTAYDMGYEAGATARAQISGKVFEATRVPPEVWIMLHQEMAYMRG